MQRETILTALETFTRQRPRLEFGNYCSGYGDTAGRKAYFAEMRSIARDKRDAERLLRAVALSSLSVETLTGAFRAYSGRLTLTEPEPGKVALDYCAGQYWPTEYRRAVCAVLSAALWDFKRDECMPTLKRGRIRGRCHPPQLRPRVRPALRAPLVRRLANAIPPNRCP